MSKFVALQLAVQLGGATEVILANAAKFADFLGEEAPPAKLTTPTRKAKNQDPPPVVAVESEQAANETTAEAAQAVVETKPQPKAEPVKAEPVKAEAASVTEADVKSLVGKVATNAAAGGAPKAREILGMFNASNISTLKPEHYAKAHAALAKVLKDAEDAAAVAA